MFLTKTVPVWNVFAGTTFMFKCAPRVCSRTPLLTRPVLGHNPTMAVTPSIPPAGNHCSRLQHTRRSRGHKSSISGEAALMSPERWRSRPLVCTHIPCVAPTSLSDRVLLPLKLRKKCTPQKSWVMPVGAMIWTPGIDPTLSGTRPPCTRHGRCLDKAVLVQGGRMY